MSFVTKNGGFFEIFIGFFEASLCGRFKPGFVCAVLAWFVKPE